jgi:hypothetical protein
MRRRYLFSVGLAFSLLVSFCAAIAQQTKPKLYDVDEAYRVYSTILPQLDSYNAKLVVIDGMTYEARVDPKCFEPSASEKFSDAIADLRRLNNTRMLLRRFDIDKPHAFFIKEKPFMASVPGGEDFWSAFYKRFEGASGVVNLSAVGFNKEMTRAVLYAGSGCHYLCGTWRFFLLEKVEGKWKEVPGVLCITQS